MELLDSASASIEGALYRSYVVIVPNTGQGEQVIIAIANVNTTVSFGEVVYRE